MSKGISPKKADAEFKRIKQVYGRLTAKTVLEASKPKKALFHKCFEWNDTAAAEKYRLQQARVLINNIQVTIVRSGNDVVELPVYEIVKDTKGRNNYVDVTNIINDQQNLNLIKRKAKRELEYWKTKYETYDQLSHVIKKVNRVLELI